MTGIGCYLAPSVICDQAGLSLDHLNLLVQRLRKDIAYLCPGQDTMSCLSYGENVSCTCLLFRTMPSALVISGPVRQDSTSPQKILKLLRGSHKPRISLQMGFAPKQISVRLDKPLQCCIKDLRPPMGTAIRMDKFDSQQ